MAGGRLLVVGTPIGNLGDLSPRAADALRTSDLIVAEDTRLAARLLAHVGARRPTTSLNEHNAAERIPGLIDQLREGRTLALTTDAGMPAVSDPGARLVAVAREAGVAVEVVPGPSAVTAAFALSGIEAGGFLFGGFLPARPASARRSALEAVVRSSRDASVPLVLYESPHRTRALLRELAEMVPDAQLVLCRELTKLHEEVIAGRPAEIAGMLAEERGEFTIVVDASHEPEAPHATEQGPVGALDAGRLAEAARAAGLSDRSIVELLSAAGIRRRAAYRLVGEHQGGRLSRDRDISQA